MKKIQNLVICQHLETSLNMFCAVVIMLIFPGCICVTEDGLSLPTKATEEFRPFMRQLPEFKFWFVVYSYLLYYGRPM